MQSAERLADDLAGLVQDRMPMGNGNRQLGALTHERPYEPHLRGLEPLEGQLSAVACFGPSPPPTRIESSVAIASHV